MTNAITEKELRTTQEVSFCVGQAIDETLEALNLLRHHREKDAENGSAPSPPAIAAMAIMDARLNAAIDEFEKAIRVGKLLADTFLEQNPK